MKKDRSTEDDEMEAGAQKNIKGGESDSVKRRKRRKVMKAKQYLDEEGFMGKGEIFSPCESWLFFKVFPFGTYILCVKFQCLTAAWSRTNLILIYTSCLSYDKFTN